MQFNTVNKVNVRTIIRQVITLNMYSMLHNKVNISYCCYNIITIVNIAYYNVITEVLISVLRKQKQCNYDVYI